MKKKKLVTPASVGANGDNISTWALPDGAVARLGQGIVDAMAFSPDGHYLAVGTRVGLWWYEVETMSPIGLWGEKRGISRISFSPNGKWIATSDWEDIIKVWDVQRGTCLTEIETKWNNFTFSPDNRWFATSDSDTATINVWLPETGEVFTKFTCGTEKGGRFMPLVFSRDTRLLASTSRTDPDNDAESIIVWDVERGDPIVCFTGHTGSIPHLYFSPCGRFLASAGREADGAVRVWDVGSCQQIQIYTDYGEANMIPAYTSDGVLHATAIACTEVSDSYNNTITVWNLESGEKLYSTEENLGMYWIMHFSGGSRLAHQSGDGGIKVWIFGNPHPYKSDYQLISYPNSIAFSGDDRMLAAESKWDREALLWDIESKHLQPIGKRQYLYTSTSGKTHVVGISGNIVTLQELRSDALPAAAFTGHEKAWVRPAFSPTANLLACADEEGTIIVWDVQSRDERCKLKHQLKDLPHDQSRIKLLEFSPDGRFLLSEENTWPSARLWDVEHGEEIREFPSEKVENVGGFSPCGSYVACSGGKAPDYMLWDVSHRGVSAIIQGEETPLSAGKYFNFAFSPCGLYVACGGELRQPEILLWDIKRGQIHKRIPLPKHYENMMALGFSHCGKYLAGGIWWQQGFERVPIHLWEVETGKQLITFWGHPTDVQAVAFSPNNELLASASFDGSILLWDLKPYL